MQGMKTEILSSPSNLSPPIKLFLSLTIPLELLFEIMLGSKDTKCICVHPENSISEEAVDCLRNLNH